MKTEVVQQRWIHDEKRRYYGVFLQRDLFGDWTLIKNWGSLDNGRDQLRMDRVADRVSGLHQIAEIAQVRLAHGYRERG